jgi:hypothetical protein
VAWKGFDLQMFWQGGLKRDWYPSGSLSVMYWGVVGGEWNSAAFKDHLDYFRNDPDSPLGLNLDSYYPRPVFNSTKNRVEQTGFLQNAAYMRLKNLQIGYTIPRQLVNKIGISNLRLFITGENLATLTNLRIMDPESAGIGRREGVTYPLVSTYSFGLSVNL